MGTRAQQRSAALCREIARFPAGPTLNTTVVPILPERRTKICAQRSPSVLDLQLFTPVRDLPLASWLAVVSAHRPSQDRLEIQGEAETNKRPSPPVRPGSVLPLLLAWVLLQTCRRFSSLGDQQHLIIIIIIIIDTE
ncbi:hypothetical protein VTJ04DRAFT_106 [Mycothermus thermophilus]|uniref:uncharacterized protein n=1 Tax=Humicola insolens TaxID=85995 RepID=UPI00374434BD